MNPVVLSLSSISVGLQLLPAFVLSIETLFGKKTGASKKDAVTTLVNASIAGTAFGLGAAGDTEYANAVSGLQPVISQTIDATVDAFNANGVFKKSTPAMPTPNAPVQVVGNSAEPAPTTAAPEATAAPATAPAAEPNPLAPINAFPETPRPRV